MKKKRPKNGPNKFGQRIKKLEKKVKELKRIDKMKDEFIDIVSHELKTPLIPIMGYVEIWEQGNLDEGLRKKSLEAVKKNAVRLKRIIDNILTISKVDADKLYTDFKPENIAKIVEECRQELQNFADEKGIQIEAKIPGNAILECDDFCMHEIIYNLLHNAIKFTPNKGKIIVDVEEYSGHLLLRIKDTGVGIPKQHLQKIFDRFYQVNTAHNREFGGTGLGLDICKTLVKKQHGNIWAESELGIGSTFFVRLPKKHG